MATLFSEGRDNEARFQKRDVKENVRRLNDLVESVHQKFLGRGVSKNGVYSQTGGVPYKVPKGRFHDGTKIINKQLENKIRKLKVKIENLMGTDGDRANLCGEYVEFLRNEILNDLEYQKICYGHLRKIDDFICSDSSTESPSDEDSFLNESSEASSVSSAPAPRPVQKPRKYHPEVAQCSKKENQRSVGRPRASGQTGTSTAVKAQPTAHPPQPYGYPPYGYHPYGYGNGGYYYPPPQPTQAQAPAPAQAAIKDHEEEAPQQESSALPISLKPQVQYVNGVPQTVYNLDMNEIMKQAGSAVPEAPPAPANYCAPYTGPYSVPYTAPYSVPYTVPYTGGVGQQQYTNQYPYQYPAYQAPITSY